MATRKEKHENLVDLLARARESRTPIEQDVEVLHSWSDRELQMIVAVLGTCSVCIAACVLRNALVVMGLVPVAVMVWSVWLMRGLPPTPSEGGGGVGRASGAMRKCEECGVQITRDNSSALSRGLGFCNRCRPVYDPQDC